MSGMTGPLLQNMSTQEFPPPCEINTEIPKFDGNNTFDTQGVLVKGKTGHGPQSCGNDTCCCPNKSVALAGGGGGSPLNLSWFL